MSLGFILLTRDEKPKEFIRREGERGHIEVALRAISECNLQSKYEKSKWGKMNNPVDFLVFEEGAIKLGTRWEDRVVTFCPNSISKKLYVLVQDYINRMYRVDEVQDTTLSSLMQFHSM